MNVHLLIFCWLLVWSHGVLAQEESEPDPDATTSITAIPRNLDFIGPAVRATVRANLPKTTPTPASVAASGAHQSLPEVDLRMLAARGLAPQINICSVVTPSSGRGAAQPPTSFNGSINQNCIANGIVLGH